ncbi:MAG: leucyl aminopeptidase family protein [Alphaproteobacteria bacterium]|nr:leucyl aminopeptidase family protein [Alphaproteobacteria bacterium]
MVFGFLDRAARATPLTLLTEKQFTPWHRKQPARVKNWLKAQGFKPEAGRHIALPGAGGRIERVIVLTGPQPGGWDIADLPSKLPEGAYRIEGALDAPAATLLATGWALGSYRYGRYKKAGSKMAQLVWPKTASRDAVQRIAGAIYRGRDLITTPAEDLGPAELAAEVRAVAAHYGAKCAVIAGEQLLQKNYPMVHAVGRASSRAPRLIDLRWGKPGDPLVALVGKGVVFDTGGLDIKPSSGMIMMKKDMGGAACALGVAEMVMDAGLPVRLRLLIPAVENAIAGNAFRPSDVLSSRKGLKVEVGNTDAEGRLVLADAMTEADSEKPALMIDFATLTGAARVALGADLPALFSNDDGLAEDLLAAGREVADPLWRLPLWHPYGRELDSKIADINSAPGGGYGGAITAALFLERFVGAKTPWAHIDLMAWNRAGKPGRPEGGEPMTARAVYRMLEKKFGKKKAA